MGVGVVGDMGDKALLWKVNYCVGVMVELFMSWCA